MERGSLACGLQKVMYTGVMCHLLWQVRHKNADPSETQSDIWFKQMYWKTLELGLVSNMSERHGQPLGCKSLLWFQGYDHDDCFNSWGTNIYLFYYYYLKSGHERHRYWKYVYHSSTTNIYLTFSKDWDWKVFQSKIFQSSSMRRDAFIWSVFSADVLQNIRKQYVE